MPVFSDWENPFVVVSFLIFAFSDCLRGRGAGPLLLRWVGCFLTEAGTCLHLWLFVLGCYPRYCIIRRARMVPELGLKVSLQLSLGG